MERTQFDLKSPPPSSPVNPRISANLYNSLIDSAPGSVDFNLSYNKS
jgi:hypothetical protein